jgi:hypothetical protein
VSEPATICPREHGAKKQFPFFFARCSEDKIGRRLIYQDSLFIACWAENSMRNLIGVGAIAAMLLIGVAWIAAAPIAGEPVAVISNPWGSSSAIEVVAAAGGTIMRAGRWGWVAVAANDDDPAFYGRLRAAGAWLLVSPIGLGTCLDETLTTARQAKRS